MDDRCIYCSPNQPAQAPFDREHVMPEAFGKFKNNLVLNVGVCACCNEYFSGHLELIFARGSWESILRLHYRIKPPETVSDLRRDRIHYSLESEDEYNGLLLEYRNMDNDIVTTIVPQVRFSRRSGSGWIYLSASELADLSKPLPDEVDKPEVIFFESDNEEMVSELRRVLAARGVEYEMGDISVLPIESGQRVKAIVETPIDDISLRCVAKVAFNYLAKTAGIGLAVQRPFDPIRAYIRYGIRPDYKPVQVCGIPILQNDSATRRQTSGHLVTVAWSPGNRHIVAQVSFFNFVTYLVTLARHFSGVWREIRSGHHFDIDARNVEPLMWPG